MKKFLVAAILAAAALASVGAASASAGPSHVLAGFAWDD